MNIGIVGLGLIGGSMAKAYKRANATVFGADKDALTTEFAKISGAIDEELNEKHFGECDIIFVAITPAEAVKWIRNNADKIPEETIVIDCCGTKRIVCSECFKIAEEHNLTYIGGHPMAGKERGGFKYSSEDLFDGAPFILVPQDPNDINLLCKVKKMLIPAGFTKIGVATAEKHDKAIAFTSQMPHVVSNGFIKSKTALLDSDLLSAGSYQDFTRVAYLDEKMWSELFLENRDFLGKELENLIDELEKYREALAKNDKELLEKLLLDGKESKDEVQRQWGQLC